MNKFNVSDHDEMYVVNSFGCLYASSSKDSELPLFHKLVKYLYYVLSGIKANAGSLSKLSLLFNGTKAKCYQQSVGMNLLSNALFYLRRHLKHPLMKF